MSFKAEVRDDGARRLVLLAGRLERAEAAELAKLCEEGPARKVRLDLTDLVSADAAALDTLRTLSARGVDLLGVSPYLALQLGLSHEKGTRKRR